MFGPRSSVTWGGTHVVGEAPGADGAAGPAGKGATDMERTDVGLAAVGDLEARRTGLGPGFPFALGL
jgi:hypothetical protein